MRKNRFCTFTLISAFAIAALPGTLASAGMEGDTAKAAEAQSLPESRSMTLTIKPAKTDSYDPAGSSYTPYRVISFTQDAAIGSWTWKLENGFHYPGEGKFSMDQFGAYPAAKLQALADKLALQVNADMSDKLETKTLPEEGSCSWTTDKAGIYLVCETSTNPGNFPAAPFLVSLPYTDPDNENSWKYEVAAAPKGSAIGLEKVIVDARGPYNSETSYTGEKDTVANGDTVKYQVSTRIPAYTDVYFQDKKNPVFSLIDTMAKGLTLQPDTIRLSSGENDLVAGRDYQIGHVTDSDGVTVITIDLKGSYLMEKTHHNTELVLAYSAVVNDSVSLLADGNDNEVRLHYSYDPLNPDSTKEIKDKVTVYSFGIEIEKFDQDEGATVPLAGAEFALYKEASKGGSAANALKQAPFRQAQATGSNGLLDFKGVDAGTYYLKEVKAPDGYSLLMNPIKVEIIPETEKGPDDKDHVKDGNFTAKVNGTTVSTGGTAGNSRILKVEGREGTVIVAAANHKGFSLPLTGGNGILFILITAAAGMVLMSILIVKGNGKDQKEESSQQT